MNTIAGKTVFITGASRGIGAATARLFADEGARVAMVARSEEALQALADEIGPNALALPCDISDRSSLVAALAKTEAHFGPIDILINNAALIDPIGPFTQVDPEKWSQLIDVNVKAVFNAMHHVVPQMIARGGGTVLTISSGAAHHAIEGWSAYCTSKAAVKMLTEVLHHEEGTKGIRAMGLSPGTVATQMQREIKASGINPVSQLEWEDHIPPEWPAKALLWMCGADADGYCGQEISLRDEDIRRRVGLLGA